VKDTVYKDSANATTRSSSSKKASEKERMKQMKKEKYKTNSRAEVPKSPFKLLKMYRFESNLGVGADMLSEGAKMRGLLVI